MTHAPIFVVLGSTGEYSDRTEWLVAYASSREDAERYIATLEAERDAAIQAADGESYSADFTRLRTLDPDFAHDYNGQTYTACEVPHIPLVVGHLTKAAP